MCILYMVFDSKVAGFSSKKSIGRTKYEDTESLSFYLSISIYTSVHLFKKYK